MIGEALVGAIFTFALALTLEWVEEERQRRGGFPFWKPLGAMAMLGCWLAAVGWAVSAALQN